MAGLQGWLGAVPRHLSTSTVALVVLMAAFLPPWLLSGVAPAVGAWVPLVTLSLILHLAGALVMSEGFQDRSVFRIELGLRAVVAGPTIALGMAVAAGAATTGSIPAARVWSAVFLSTVLTSFLAVAIWTSRPYFLQSLHIEGRGPALPIACRTLKRMTDLVVAVPVLLLVAPAMIAAMVAIMVESRGGWLFSHDRLGLGGRTFRLFKLRTMVAGNDDKEHQAYVAALVDGNGETNEGLYKLAKDPRRTAVGAFLRRLSIDEIPQLWNVVRGDMSLVGPRPATVADAALYDARAWDRLVVKPGITGLWQVSGRSTLTFAEMIDLDLRYCERWTPLLDLKILLRTPKVALWDRQTA
jgi:lipopolysaccharide/colanic/teichoic acid biosynthesis glycosyltransferase